MYAHPRAALDESMPRPRGGVAKLDLEEKRVTLSEPVMCADRQ
jgi:hypothetical protein